MITLLFFIEKHINNLIINIFFFYQTPSSSSSSSLNIIRTRSEDVSLLTMQETHVLQYVWNGHSDQVLIVRGKSSICSRGEQIPAQIIPYMEQIGFLEIAKL